MTANVRVSLFRRERDAANAAAAASPSVLRMDPTPTQRVLTGIGFDRMTDRMLRQTSVVEVKHANAWHPVTGKLMEQGMYDRLMGALGATANLACLTCFRVVQTDARYYDGFVDCAGHHGHIELPTIVYQPTDAHQLRQLFGSFCVACGEVLVFGRRRRLAMAARLWSIQRDECRLRVLADGSCGSMAHICGDQLAAAAVLAAHAREPTLGLARWPWHDNDTNTDTVDDDYCVEAPLDAECEEYMQIIERRVADAMGDCSDAPTRAQLLRWACSQGCGMPQPLFFVKKPRGVPTVEDFCSLAVSFDWSPAYSRATVDAARRSAGERGLVDRYDGSNAVDDAEEAAAEDEAMQMQQQEHDEEAAVLEAAEVDPEAVDVDVMLAENEEAVVVVGATEAAVASDSEESMLEVAAEPATPPRRRRQSTATPAKPASRASRDDLVKKIFAALSTPHGTVTMDGRMCSQLLFAGHANDPYRLASLLGFGGGRGLVVAEWKESLLRRTVLVTPNTQRTMSAEQRADRDGHRPKSGGHIMDPGSSHPLGEIATWCRLYREQEAKFGQRDAAQTTELVNVAALVARDTASDIISGGLMRLKPFVTTNADNLLKTHTMMLQRAVAMLHGGLGYHKRVQAAAAAISQTMRRSRADSGGVAVARSLGAAAKAAASQRTGASDRATAASDGQFVAAEQSLGGKEGRLRGNLQGKRTDYAARTVITPDPSLPIDCVRVPRSIAAQLARPMNVTAQNRHRLARVVYALSSGVLSVFGSKNSTREDHTVPLHVRPGRLPSAAWPVAAFVASATVPQFEQSANARTLADARAALLHAELQDDPAQRTTEHLDALRHAVTVADRVHQTACIAAALCIGDSIECPLDSGAYVLLNRQPTLHKGGALGFTVFVSVSSAFGTNPNSTASFNADYDGDEMNLHVLTNLVAEAELRELTMLGRNIVTPQSGEPRNGPKQDTLLGAYLLSARDALFERSEVQQLAMAACTSVYDMMPDMDERRLRSAGSGPAAAALTTRLPIPAILKCGDPASPSGKPLWTGKQLLSHLTLPDDLNMSQPRSVADHLSASLADNPIQRASFDAQSSEAAALTTDSSVLIVAGQLLSGRFDARSIGPKRGSVCQLLVNDAASRDLGEERIMCFMNRLNGLTMAYLEHVGVSVGIGDLMLSPADKALVCATIDAGIGPSSTRLLSSPSLSPPSPSGRQRPTPIHPTTWCGQRWQRPPLPNKPARVVARGRDVTPFGVSLLPPPVAQSDLSLADCSSAELSRRLYAGLLPAEWARLDKFEQHVRRREAAAQNGITTLTLAALARDARHRSCRTNPVLDMALAGIKGSDLNIRQMAAVVGPQEISGRRIADWDRVTGYDQPLGHTPTARQATRLLAAQNPRYLSHQPRDGRYPTGEAGGFVRHSFVDGLSPAGFFNHAVSGRKGCTDTAIGTAVVGYNNHRLVKGMEDLMVRYDQSVRRWDHRIIQFSYGEDGYDGAALEGKTVWLPLTDCSNNNDDLYVESRLTESGRAPLVTARRALNDAQCRARAAMHDELDRNDLARLADLQPLCGTKNSTHTGIRLQIHTPGNLARCLELADAAAIDQFRQWTTRPSEKLLAHLASSIGPPTCLNTPTQRDARYHVSLDQALTTATDWAETTEWTAWASAFAKTANLADVVLERLADDSPGRQAAPLAVELEVRTHLALPALLARPAGDWLVLLYARHSLTGSTSDPLSDAVTSYCTSMRLALVAAGEAVGALAAMALGEPSTQVTLNSFQASGRTLAAVTSGVGRMTAIASASSRDTDVATGHVPEVLVHLADLDSKATQQCVEAAAHLMRPRTLGELLTTTTPTMEVVEVPLVHHNHIWQPAASSSLPPHTDSLARHDVIGAYYAIEQSLATRSERGGLACRQHGFDATRFGDCLSQAVLRFDASVPRLAILDTLWQQLAPPPTSSRVTSTTAARLERALQSAYPQLHVLAGLDCQSPNILPFEVRLRRCDPSWSALTPPGEKLILEELARLLPKLDISIIFEFDTMEAPPPPTVLPTLLKRARGPALDAATKPGNGKRQRSMSRREIETGGLLLGQASAMRIHGADNDTQLALTAATQPGERSVLRLSTLDLAETLSRPGVDVRRTGCTSISVIERTLGLEAARAFIPVAIEHVVRMGSAPIDRRHMELLADAQCATGQIRGVTSSDMLHAHGDWLSHANYEQPQRAFGHAVTPTLSSSAAGRGCSTTIRLAAPSSCVAAGTLIPYLGTNAMGVLLDTHAVMANPLADAQQTEAAATTSPMTPPHTPSHTSAETERRAAFGWSSHHASAMLLAAPGSPRYADGMQTVPGSPRYDDYTDETHAAPSPLRYDPLTATDDDMGGGGGNATYDPESVPYEYASAADVMPYNPERQDYDGVDAVEYVPSSAVGFASALGTAHWAAYQPPVTTRS